jgi:hypothetical protein
MFFAYVDESYRDPGDRYFMSGVVCTEQQVWYLNRDLDAIMERLSRQYALGSDAEIHGYDIWNGVNDWRAMKGQWAALGAAFVEILEAIVKNSSYVLWRGVSVPSQIERGYRNIWPPEQVSFQHLLERIEEVAGLNTVAALVIRDEVPDPNAPRLLLQTYRKGGTPGYKQLTLAHIIDTIHFAPSKHSRGLQAADIVAFVVQLHEHWSQLPPLSQPVATALYDVIAQSGKLHAPGTWP